MEAKGTLEPLLRQDIYAGIDGKVEELLVDHGQHVVKGQLLVKLGGNSELEVQLPKSKAITRPTSTSGPSIKG